jgi:hypothetical protein
MPSKFVSCKGKPRRSRDDPPTFVCPICHTLTARSWRSNKRGSGSWVYGQKFCSKGCANRSRAIDHGALDRHGYAVLRWQGYPQIYVHRLMMEQMLGRELQPYETVHHKNGKRADNRSENLELWSSRHGRGQRVSDQLIAALGHGAGNSNACLSFGC